MQKKKRKITEYIISMISMVAFLTFMIGACSFTIDSWIPIIMCVVSAAWLAFVIYIYKDLPYEVEEEEF